MTKISSFIIAAILLIIGTFYAVPSEARVCFATDPECGSGGNFGNMDDLKQYDDACKKYNYTYENSCPAEYIKYVCPYKSTWLKCCGKQFRYEGCIYPLEIDKSQIGEVVDGVAQYGKCGTRYACKCPDEYEISSEYAETNNCQPGGGYCMLNDGTTDTVKYKTCICDKDIYTDADSCKNNQTELSSCRDDKGDVRKKCHCDRGVYPKTSCEFGGKGSSCIDSNSGREYYKECKTAAELCEEKGYYKDCGTWRTNSTNINYAVCERDKSKSTHPYICESGEQCPYHPDYYKCIFSIRSYCTDKGFTKEDIVRDSGASCTNDDGIPGTKRYCTNQYGSLYGADQYNKYYYKCQTTCKQQLLAAGAARKLNPDTRFGVDKDGNYIAWYRTDTDRNYHLYLTESFTLPEKGLPRGTALDGDKHLLLEGNTAIGYDSVNSMYALADVDAKKYDACEDERLDNFGKVELKIPERYGEQEWNDWKTTTPDGNHFFDRNFSDISLNLIDDPSDDATDFFIEDDTRWTWKNVYLKLTGQPYGLACYICYAGTNGKNNRKQVLCDGNHAKTPKISGSNLTYWETNGNEKTVQFSPYTEQADDVCGKYTGWTYQSQATSHTNKHTGDYNDIKIKYAHFRHLIKLQNAILTITGEFRASADWIFSMENRSGNYTSGPKLHLYIDTKSTIVFKDISYGYVYGVDFDGASNGQMLFYDVDRLYMPRVWSYWNIGFENSTVYFDELKIRAVQTNKSDVQSTIGGTSFNAEKAALCRGMYLKNSHVTVSKDYMLMRDNYGKIYIDKDSTLETSWPIILVNNKSSVICNKGTLKVKGQKCELGSSRCTSNTGIFYSGKGNWGCVGVGNDTLNKAVCDRKAEPNYMSGLDSWGSRYKSGKTWQCSRSQYTLDNYGVDAYQGFCSTCNICETYGLGVRKY